MGRRAQRPERNARKQRASRAERQFAGLVKEVEAYTAREGKYDLAWFQPRGQQQEIVDAIDAYDWVVVQGSSGVGKTTTVVWKALSLLGAKYRRIVFVKNPTEAGDDKIGFLTGDADDKLEAHFESMRGVFLDFMNKGKLETDENNRNIVFKIPNFMLGATLSDTILIIDEGQTMSPKTLKLLMERVDDSCKVILLGDKAQTYAVDSRPDGFTDFVNRVTTVDQDGRYSVEPLLTYIEINSSGNQRGAISRRVTELYA